MVDTQHLKCCAYWRAGSTPAPGTKKKALSLKALFSFLKKYYTKRK